MRTRESTVFFITNDSEIHSMETSCFLIWSYKLVKGQIRENVLKNGYAKRVGYKQFVVFHQN